MPQFTLKRLLCDFIGFGVGCAGHAMPLQHFDAAEKYGFAVYAIAGAGLSGTFGILAKKTWQGMVLGAVAGM